VDIVKLSIPDLLAEEDPLKYLEKMLPKPIQSITTNSSSASLKTKTPGIHQKLSYICWVLLPSIYTKQKNLL
jgi:hypothetical protein